jgi:hypothetical protein
MPFAMMANNYEGEPRIEMRSRAASTFDIKDSVSKDCFQIEEESYSLMVKSYSHCLFKTNP